MKTFIMMLSFFTRIPIANRIEYDEDTYRKGLVLLPLVGLVIGIFLYGVSYINTIINNKDITAIILIISYIWITGGLHIDGYIDSIDGLFSNRSRDRILEIMKDSNVGAFGVIGVILLILFYFVIFSNVEYIHLIIMPVVARNCGIIASAISSYARNDASMGKIFIDNMGMKDSIISITLTLIVTFIVNKIAVISVIICIIVAILLTKYIKQKINGLTGDSIGMIIEFSQACYLLSVYFIGELVV